MQSVVVYRESKVGKMSNVSGGDGPSVDDLDGAGCFKGGERYVVLARECFIDEGKT